MKNASAASVALTANVRRITSAASATVNASAVTLVSVALTASARRITSAAKNASVVPNASAASVNVITGTLVV